MTQATADMVARLQALLAQDLGLTVPSGDTDLVAEGIIDSLALIEMLVAIETDFDVRIELDTFDIERARTLSRLASWILTLQGGANSDAA